METLLALITKDSDQRCYDLAHEIRALKKTRREKHTKLKLGSCPEDVARRAFEGFDGMPELLQKTLTDLAMQQQIRSNPVEHLQLGRVTEMINGKNAEFWMRAEMIFGLEPMQQQHLSFNADDDIEIHADEEEDDE